MADQVTAPATDDDIQRIIGENEAGVATLLASYEHIERGYFAAVSASADPQAIVVTAATTAS
jgi:hypothetical protein